MEKLSKQLEKNISNIKTLFGLNQQVVYRYLTIGTLQACLVYTRGMTDVNFLASFVLKPCAEVKQLPEGNVYNYIKNEVVLHPELEDAYDFNLVQEELPKGKVFLFIDTINKAIAISADSLKERSLAEPPTSAVLMGPRVGFNENIKTNLSTLKKILATPHFQAQTVLVGKLTQTQVTVCYLNNVAKKAVVNEIMAVIKSISIDGIIDSFYISSFLEKRKNSMFKQVGTSEKPDVVCAKLLEGRVAVLVDGSPIVLTLPYILLEDFQSSNDYYSQSKRTTLTRMLRLVSFILTVMLPGAYIAVLLYHSNAVPLKLLITIMNSTQGLPFSPFMEILFILILFEILYEASQRMPKYLGLALSVVGALILGDTAVKAGLISPPAVMVVALSGIMLYVIPEQAPQLSLLRFGFTFAGGILGFYGIVLLAVFVVMHLNNFDAYGSPYLAPFAPFIKADAKDAFKKEDLVDQVTRPKSIPNQNKVRMKK